MSALTKPRSSLWTTGDEKRFVLTLIPPSLLRTERIKALRVYLASLHRRSKWCGIDRAQLESYVEELIEAEKKALGGGLRGAREYATPVGEYRREIRRGGEDDGDEAA